MKNERYSSSLAFRERETVKKAALIFRHDADINQKDQDGNTVLYNALKHRCSIKTIQRLLNAGADVNARNHDGATPLLVLLQQSNSVLLPGSDDPDYFPFPDSSEEKSIQHTECDVESFFTEAVLLLLNAGADVNICNNHGDTPLIIACRYYGGSTILKILIAAGADVNYRGRNGVTPLMEVLKTAPDWLYTLSEEHSLQHSETSDCLDPFYDKQSPAAVKILLEAGADVNAKDESGCTPLMYAVKFNTCSRNIVQLLEARAVIDAEDHYGRGVFHHLGERAAEERLKFLPLLTSSAADGRTHDKLGYTPWAYWSLRDSGCSDLLQTAGDFVYCLFPGWKHVKAVKTAIPDPAFQKMLDQAEIIQGNCLDKLHYPEVYSRFLYAAEELQRNKPLQEDDSYCYFNFSSLFDMLLYKRLNKTTRELRLAERNYGQFYYLYSKLCGNDEALLQQAITWSPMNTLYWFQYAELLRMRGDLETFRKLTLQMFHFLYTRESIGLAYQNLGFYYANNKNYELAAMLYRISMEYAEDTGKARTELLELSDISGINFKYRHWKINEIKNELKKCSLPAGASNTVLETACQWWRLAQEKKAYDVAHYLRDIYHSLTSDKSSGTFGC